MLIVLIIIFLGLGAFFIFKDRPDSSSKEEYFLTKVEKKPIEYSVQEPPKPVIKIKEPEVEQQKKLEKPKKPKKPFVAYDELKPTKAKEEPEEFDPKQVGSEFEGYLADILKGNKIRLKQWNQGSTSPGGAYAENELNPDFLVVHKEGDLEYWVECKFRSVIPDKGFYIRDYQLNRYASIQAQSRRKILIAVGEGGAPSAPAFLYLIPLDDLKRFKRIGKKYLPQYKVVDPEENFKVHVRTWFEEEVFKKSYKKDG